MVSARGPTSQLETEHQGFANLGVDVWSSSAIEEAIWHVRDQLPSDCQGSLQHESTIMKYHRLRWPHQFSEACDEHTGRNHWKCRVRGSWTDGGSGGRAFHDEATGLPLETELMADACQGRAGRSCVNSSKSLGCIGTRWVYTNKGDAANSFICPSAVAQETKRVSELTPEDASSTFAATPPLEGLKFKLSRCMAGDGRPSADVKVLGFYNISGAHFHSPARRMIVIKVPKEDCECTSGFAVLDTAMYGTKDAAQCFYVASESAMTRWKSPEARFRFDCIFRAHLTCPCSRHKIATQGDRRAMAPTIHLIVKYDATFGPCIALGVTKKVETLNRFVRWSNAPDRDVNVLSAKLSHDTLN